MERENVSLSGNSQQYVFSSIGIKGELVLRLRLMIPMLARSATKAPNKLVVTAEDSFHLC